MDFSPALAQLYNSPKRKRGQEIPLRSPTKSESAPCEPPILGHPQLFAREIGNDEPLSTTGQTSMTGHFQTLAIRGSHMESASPSDDHARKRVAHTIVDTELSGYATTPPSIPNHQAQPFQPPAASAFAFSATALPTAPPTSNSLSPGRRRKSRSPPLDGEQQDNFWHDSEITGHDPTDPTDDGYGINGIGFKPTPAIAWARSQQRKRQLTEYKSRETREARQKRSERRRVVERKEEIGGVREGKNGMRVRFEDV